MKMTAIRNLFKTTTLFATAFVLAVSTLTAAVPFLLSKEADAAEVSSVSVDNITNYGDLKAALADSSVGYINLAPGINITTPEELELSRSDVRINGNDSTITYTGPNAGVSGWNGLYVFQAYNVTNVEINSLRVAGADAGILINGSEVTLKGNTHVLNNEFGGVEVSQGTAPHASVLTLEGNVWDESELETAGKPAVWVINGQGSIVQTNLNSQLIAATHVKPNQTQYYLRDVNAGIVATNATQGTTYATLQAAVTAAADDDTIELNKDVVLGQMQFIDKPLTLDGKGHTITAPYSYTTNGVDNAVLTITANNVTIQNLTTDNTATAVKPHGIVVQNVTGITLENLVLKNGRAGMILNGSVVNIKDVHTIGNSWYGINVDKASAKLTISGNNSHADLNGAPAIYVDDRTLPAVPAVNDINNQYDIVASGLSDAYFIDVTAPQAPIITNSPVLVNAAEAYELARWTHNGVDVDHFEYREYASLEAAEADNAYWVQIRTAAEREQIVGHSWTTDMTLYYRIVAVDANGNRSTPSLLGKVIIDKNAPIITLEDQVGTSSTPTIRGTVSEPDVTVTVTIGTEPFIATVDAEGNWEYTVATPLAVGTYVVTVVATDRAENASEAKYNYSFTVATQEDDGDGTVDPSNPGQNPGTGTGNGNGNGSADTGGSNGGGTVNTGTPLTNPLVVAVPSIISPAVALGASTDASATNSDDNTAGVEGASAANTAAQAVDSEANTGTFLGLGWYWWLLIIALLAAIAWWIIAAIRKRQAE